MASQPHPIEIKYSRDARVLTVRFDSDESFDLSAEYLRVHSPSAEVRGHGPGQEVLQIGKEDAAIDGIEPVGNYAVRLRFSDGHSSGLYSFTELYRLGSRHQELWQAYLDKLAEAGVQRRDPMSEPDYTHFGFQRVAADDKVRRVREVFDSVADRYDVMNDLMSLGLHRLWKRFTVGICNVREGGAVLDLAGGTGDLAGLLHDRVGSGGRVVLTDINAAMLERGRRRMEDGGRVAGLSFAQVNAESLPFADGSFDCVTIGFGLRNVTDKQRALSEMCRVLRPGGQALVLEFSRLRAPALQSLYDLYSFKVLPWLGQRVAGDANSYRYLAESIRVHPDQEDLAQMMTGAGFENCEWFNLSLGVVAVHRGWRS